jgi:uncharacterized membrane protein YphA (DoxX/SURF4 family)
MRESRVANSVVVWILSIVLAAIFLIAGVPKLIGAGTVVLEAAAMRGYPDWLRVVVGLAEVAGAIALLIPRVSTYGAVTLALLMIPATITQKLSGEPGVYIPIVLFFVLLFVAWRRNPAALHSEYRSVTGRPHPVLHEGVIAGLIGATCIAIWFFLVDLVAGRPLFTPATLGRSLFRVFGPEPAGESTALYVVAYTIVHYVAFIVVGLIAAGVVRLARREPTVLVGFAILFIAFEVGFYALVALLQHATALGSLAWYQVMAGNLIAAVAMGAYILRVHPALPEQFTHAMDVRQ